MLTEQEIIQMELDEIEAERRAELLDRMDILDIQYNELQKCNDIESRYNELKLIRDKISKLNDEM